MALLQQGGNGNLIGNLAKQFGVSESQVNQLVGQAAPKLARGIGQEINRNNGDDSILNAIQNGDLVKYTDTTDEDPSIGNNLLGKVFSGSQQNRMANQLSRKSGIGSNVVQQMLPTLLTSLLGNAGNQAQSQGLSSAGSIAGLLGGGRSGNKLGGIMKLVGGLLGKR